MRRLKRYLITSIAAVSVLLLAGCAAEAPDGPITAPDDSPFYLTFELATAMDTSGGPVHAPGTRPDNTRAGEVSKRSDELSIQSIIAYMVDAEGTNSGKIAGVAYGEKVTIGTLSNGKRTVTLNMGLNTLYTRQHKYRVYVLANVADNTFLTNDVVGKNISEINEKVLQFSTTKFANTPTILPSNLITTGIPFSTTTEDAAKIQVWLEEKTAEGTGDYSTPGKAYVVKADTKNISGNPNSQEEAATLMLTPLFSRLDFVYNGSKTDFKYPIQYTSGEGSSVQTVTEMYVEFKRARVVGAARNVYTILKGGTAAQVTAGQTYVSPSGSLTTAESGASGYFNIVHSESGSAVAGKDNPGIYVPEFIPTLGDATMLNYNQLTYLEMDAVIVIDDNCAVSDEVRAAYNAHSALCYYDDGKYQSTLMVKDDSKTGSNWKVLPYNSALGGYVVTYRHGIRHSAGPSNNWTDSDGIVYPMEYGVVRNHLYQIGIHSVSALPHPWTVASPIESKNKDINIQIKSPVWTQHRSSFEIEM